jgi:hypothetical protein
MDKKAIDNDIIEYLDKIYVRKDTCTERQMKTEKEISEILITQGTITTKLAFIEKLSLIITTATVGMLVAQIGGAIFGK